MAISCEPSDLAEAAACFECIDANLRPSIELYLLRSIAGLEDQTPQDLAEAAKCFACLDPKRAKEIAVYLLCEIVNK